MHVAINRLQPDELEQAVALFAREVYPGDTEAAGRHFADHADAGGDTFLATVEGALAGYVTIRWVSHNERFREEGIPLIHDLLVFEPYQRRGIGGMLMDAAEALIATRAAKAGITVGLFDAYGPAQRLYAKRGYMPDGRGACRGHTPLCLGDAVTMDHDLILWLTKDLR